MKKKYWILLLIMFTITLIIPIFQTLNLSKAVPIQDSTDQMTAEYFIVSDMSQDVSSLNTFNSSLIIVEAMTSAVILGIGLNIFADSVFNKELSIELEQDSRLKIYNIIKDNQGIHLREICRKLNKKMGVIQYHIHVLEKADLVDSVKEGRYRRFFIHDNNGDDQKTIICFLQRDSAKKILEFLLFNEEGKTSHSDLAGFLGISSQAITWHMKKLEAEGIVDFEKVGKQKYYSLNVEYQRLLLEFFGRSIQ